MPLSNTLQQFPFNMTNDQIKKITPTGCKLAWKEVSSILYTYSYLAGSLSLEVSQSTNRNSDHFGKWGIVIGMRYYSRDTEKYWSTKEIAMRKAEKLAELVCLAMLDKLAPELLVRVKGKGIGE